MRIRDARPTDAAVIAAMIHELVAFEGNSSAPSFTVDQLALALVDPPARLRAIIAEDSDGAVGFVSYTIDFAIWAGGNVVRVDDVFVRERVRRQGIGGSLMLHIAGIAIRGDMTCRWEIEPANHEAQCFYERLGVEIRDKRVARWSLPEMRKAKEQGRRA